MKKIYIFIALIVIIACLSGINYLMNSSKIRVDTFNADITLNQSGDMVVSETWITKWPEGKHVSFRDIGYRKYNPGNPLYQEKDNEAFFDEESVSVEVLDKNNQKLASDKYRVGYSFNNDRDELGQPVECYPYREDCESIFVQVYGGMQSKMTFKYNYTIKGAVTEYSDVSELNWNLLEYFESGISNSTVTIRIPNISKDDIRAWGHGLSKGEVIIDDNKVTLEIDEIKKGEILEFRILTPKTTFTSIRDINFVNKDMESQIVNYESNLAIETNKRIQIAQYLYYGTFLIVALMAIFTYLAYVKYDKEYKPQYDGKYYRELPAEYTPAEMSYLYYFRKINDEDVTATLLDLVRRKYLILDNNGQGVNEKDPNFKIILNKEQDYNTLLPHEKHLISWFINNIGNSSEVTLNQIEQYPKLSYQKAMYFQEQARLFVQKAKEAGKRHDFFEKKLSSAKSVLFLATLIPFIYIFICLYTASRYQINNSFSLIACISIIVIYLIYVSSIDKRSINGNEEYTKWKAFKEFLLEFGRMKDYPMPGIVVWEHYLVYATSLKIADKVMEQLQVRVPNISEDATVNQTTFIGFGYRYYGFHYGYTLGRINRTMYTARANGNNTIAQYNTSRVSGVGRGGGFGGGRSFGGGGGGFRGR